MRNSLTALGSMQTKTMRRMGRNLRKMMRRVVRGSDRDQRNQRIDRGSDVAVEGAEEVFEGDDTEYYIHAYQGSD